MKESSIEEDIKHLEKRIDLNRQMYLEFGRLLSLDKETVNAIENLINKNKELENMVDEMVSFIEVAELDEDIAKTYCKNETCTDINSFNCKKCIIEYFKMKASEENEHI